MLGRVVCRPTWSCCVRCVLVLFCFPTGLLLYIFGCFSQYIRLIFLFAPLAQNIGAPRMVSLCRELAGGVRGTTQAHHARCSDVLGSSSIGCGSKIHRRQHL